MQSRTGWTIVLAKLCSSVCVCGCTMPTDLWKILSTLTQQSSHDTFETFFSTLGSLTYHQMTVSPNPRCWCNLVSKEQPSHIPYQHPGETRVEKNKKKKKKRNRNILPNHNTSYLNQSIWACIASLSAMWTIWKIKFWKGKKDDFFEMEKVRNNTFKLSIA